MFKFPCCCAREEAVNCRYYLIININPESFSNGWAIKIKLDRNLNMCEHIQRTLFNLFLTKISLHSNLIHMGLYHMV